MDINGYHRGYQGYRTGCIDGYQWISPWISQWISKYILWISRKSNRIYRWISMDKSLDISMDMDKSLYIPKDIFMDICRYEEYQKINCRISPWIQAGYQWICNGYPLISKEDILLYPKPYPLICTKDILEISWC